MPHSLGVTATLGILTLAGAGAGVQLGRSAIAEINPAYFSSPPPRAAFHADLTPTGYAPSNAVDLAEIERTAALGSGCVGCRDFPVEYQPVRDAELERYLNDPRSLDPPLRMAAYEAPEEDSAEIARREAALARVARYAGLEPEVAEQETAAGDPQGEAEPIN